jgi:hypothetical protein
MLFVFVAACSTKAGLIGWIDVPYYRPIAAVVDLVHCMFVFRDNKQVGKVFGWRFSVAISRLSGLLSPRVASRAEHAAFFASSQRISIDSGHGPNSGDGEKNGLVVSTLGYERWIQCLIGKVGGHGAAQRHAGVETRRTRRMRRRRRGRFPGVQ